MLIRSVALLAPNQDNSNTIAHWTSVHTWGRSVRRWAIRNSGGREAVHAAMKLRGVTDSLMMLQSLVTGNTIDLVMLYSIYEVYTY